MNLDNLMTLSKARYHGNYRRLQDILLTRKLVCFSIKINSKKKNSRWIEIFEEMARAWKIFDENKIKIKRENKILIAFNRFDTR